MNCSRCLRRISTHEQEDNAGRCTDCRTLPDPVAENGKCDAEIWKGHRGQKCDRTAKGRRELHRWNGPPVDRPVCGIHLHAKFTPNLWATITRMIAARAEHAARQAEGTS